MVIAQLPSAADRTSHMADAAPWRTPIGFRCAWVYGSSAMSDGVPVKTTIA